MSQELNLDPKRLGPVALRPIFQERIWGVETLPDWYPQPAAGKPIGEAWLTAETCVVDSGMLGGISIPALTISINWHATASGTLGHHHRIRTITLIAEGVYTL